jgi:hypothetical protein
MRLGCALRLRISPARPCCCGARVVPCCADTAAASPSAAALRCCGYAQRDRTPLHCAARRGQVVCVALLVERGANKEAKNNVRCAAPSPTAAAAAACCVRVPPPIAPRALRALLLPAPPSLADAPCCAHSVFVVATPLLLRWAKHRWM